jgi:hypothetical protein
MFKVVVGLVLVLWPGAVLGYFLYLYTGNVMNFVGAQVISSFVCWSFEVGKNLLSPIHKKIAPHTHLEP